MIFYTYEVMNDALCVNVITGDSDGILSKVRPCKDKWRDREM